jgi:hypothetical protein
MAQFGKRFPHSTSAKLSQFVHATNRPLPNLFAIDFAVEKRRSRGIFASAMKISRNARHWFPLPFALAWFVIALLAFADFSGEPAPRWREVSLVILPGIVFLFFFLNQFMDRREKNPRE